MSKIKDKALSLGIKRVPLWVDAWEEWVIIQSLSGEERADLLQKCTEVVKNAQGKNEGKVNLKRMYPMLTILSVCEPIVSILPDRNDPHYHLYPGATDDQGNFLTPPLPESEQGKPVFVMTELVALNKQDGAPLEQIAQFSSSLSKLTQKDIEDEKKASETVVVESDGYTLG